MHGKFRLSYLFYVCLVDHLFGQDLTPVAIFMGRRGLFRVNVLYYTPAPSEGASHRI